MVGNSDGTKRYKVLCLTTSSPFMRKWMMNVHMHS
jgi:hypothetical protein